MEKLYTVNELAEYLQLKPQTVRENIVAAGKIRAIKVSNKWRVPESAVKEFLEAREQKQIDDKKMTRL